MKVKEIEAKFGVPPATLFDWCKDEHKKSNLAKLLKNISKEEAEKIMNTQTKKPKPMMILSTVNCSIGDKSKHFTLTSLKKLFYKEKDGLNPYEKYALKTIKLEAEPDELNDFISYYKIPQNRVEKLLSA